MKRGLLLRAFSSALILISISKNIYSQNNAPISNPAAPIEQCGFDQMHAEKMMSDPTYQQNTINFNNAMQYYNPDGKVSNTPYRIPVVVQPHQLRWSLL